MSISEKVWPYGIGTSIVFVFGLCVATIIVTSSANIQESNAYMTNYQEADMDANKFIQNKIAFNKKYIISFVNAKLEQEGTTLRYKLMTKAQKSVENAKLKLFISRPETDEFDKTVQNASYSDGSYSFKKIIFEKAGVWNLILKVTVGDLSRFYNIKADTRSAIAYEY